MFKFSKRDFKISDQEFVRFVEVLTKIQLVLRGTGNIAQADFITKLIESAKKNDINVFVKLINSNDMWGGQVLYGRSILKMKPKVNCLKQKLLILLI